MFNKQGYQYKENYPFYMVPKHFIDEGYPKALNNSCLLVLNALLYHLNNQNGLCCPSIETIADDVNIAPATVKRRLKELREFNIIAIKKKNRKGSKWRNNHYIINEPFDWKPPFSLKEIYLKRRQSKNKDKREYTGLRVSYKNNMIAQCDTSEHANIN